MNEMDDDITERTFDIAVRRTSDGKLDIACSVPEEVAPPGLPEIMSIIGVALAGIMDCIKKNDSPIKVHYLGLKVEMDGEDMIFAIRPENSKCNLAKLQI
jgi:hypothetical protein